MGTVMALVMATGFVVFAEQKPASTATQAENKAPVQTAEEKQWEEKAKESCKKQGLEDVAWENCWKQELDKSKKAAKAAKVEKSQQKPATTSN